MTEICVTTALGQPVGVIHHFRPSRLVCNNDSSAAGDEQGMLNEECTALQLPKVSQPTATPPMLGSKKNFGFLPLLLFFH